MMPKEMKQRIIDFPIAKPVPAMRVKRETTVSDPPTPPEIDPPPVEPGSIYTLATYSGVGAPGASFTFPLSFPLASDMVFVTATFVNSVNNSYASVAIDEEDYRGFGGSELLGSGTFSIYVKAENVYSPSIGDTSFTARISGSGGSVAFCGWLLQGVKWTGTKDTYGSCSFYYWKVYEGQENCVGQTEQRGTTVATISPVAGAFNVFVAGSRPNFCDGATTGIVLGGGSTAYSGTVNAHQYKMGTLGAGAQSVTLGSDNTRQNACCSLMLYSIYPATT